MPRTMSEETRRTLIARKAALTSLASHPSWPELEAEVARKEARIEKLVLAKTLGGLGAVDEREILYLRGFVHGMKWFARVPPSAENALESFLREQGLRVEEETTT